MTDDLLIHFPRSFEETAFPDIHTRNALAERLNMSLRYVFVKVKEECLIEIPTARYLFGFKTADKQ